MISLDIARPVVDATQGVTECGHRDVTQNQEKFRDDGDSMAIVDHILGPRS